MDSTRPRAPARADEPSADLLEAVERASRVVGAGGPPGSVAVRFDASGGRRAAARAAALGSALLVLGAGALLLLPAPRQSPQEVEEDLRWAVAQVVREVESFRARTGRLPEPARLAPLLSERVVYEPAEDAYVVTGLRDDVRVRWDGTVPLEVWLQGR